MRDINRIDVILSKLREVWMQNPDWRLGQLIINSLTLEDMTAGAPVPTFYLEDDEMYNRLEVLNLKTSTKKS